MTYCGYCTRSKSHDEYIARLRAKVMSEATTEPQGLGGAVEPATDLTAPFPTDSSLSPEAVRVNLIKARLAALCTRNATRTAELDAELIELRAAHKAAMQQGDHWRALSFPPRIERVRVKLDGVHTEINAVRMELDAAVTAPMSGNRDPTKWLPDEILIAVFEWLDPKTMLTVIHAVCRRWRSLCGHIRDVKLDVRFLSARAKLSNRAVCEVTKANMTASLSKLASRFEHVSAISMVCCPGTLALACTHLQWSSGART